MAFIGTGIPKRFAAERSAAAARKAEEARQAAAEARESVQESLKTAEIELCLGRQLAGKVHLAHDELAHRVAKMRRKFARQYGFVVPDIKLTDSMALPPKSYQIRIHGTAVATCALRLGEVLVVVGEGPRLDYPGEEVREPAFGMKAIWMPEIFADDLKREGFAPVDPISIVLTHLSEVVRNNLAQLLSYKDMRALLDRLEPEYKRLIDDICPAHISQSGLQAVLKLLLAERISIRNLNLMLEAIAEIVPMRAGRSRWRSTCACGWRSRFAATSRRTAHSRSCVSATAGISLSTRASSGTPRATWSSSTSTPACSNNSGRKPPRPFRPAWTRATRSRSSRPQTPGPTCAW